MIKAKVVNLFKEKEHNDHVYSPGDVYPAEGYEANSERVKFLSQVHQKYKKIYLAEIEVDEENDEGEAKKPEAKELAEQNTNKNEFPKHTGGGWYMLSSGEKVHGKDEALAAENALQKE